MFRTELSRTSASRDVQRVADGAAHLEVELAVRDRELPPLGEPLGERLADPGRARGESFVEQGFVKLENASPRTVAEEVVAILARDVGCDLRDSSTWTRPVVRLEPRDAYR